MRILAIDISHLFRRCYEATGGKELSEAYKRTVQTVADIRVGYDRVAILCDAGPSFRTAIDPSFKTDRERPAAPFYEQQTRTINRLRDDGCVAFYAPSVTIEGDPRELYAEADDLCAALAQWCINREDESPLLHIYSGDKSLLQIVDDEHDIAVICPDKGAQDAAAVEKRIGLPPARIVDWLALAGKTGDNYKPFPGWTDDAGKHNGIGDKTAVAMVIEHGSAIAAVAMLDAKDADDNPAHGYKPAVFAALSRGLPTPNAAVVRGLNLATLRRDLEVDFSPLLAEPVYARISETISAPIIAEYPTNGMLCSVCHKLGMNEPQRDTECGPVCKFGHGGADGVAHRFDPPVEYEQEIPADAPSVASTAMAPHDSRTSAVTRFGEQYRAADSMMALASKFYDARMFGTFPNAEAIFVTMWLAAERGENVGNALVNAYVIKAGKAPGYLATYLAARVKASPVCKVFRIIASERDYAVLEYQRIDDAEPMTYRFDLQEAIDAGWVKDDGAWQKRPRAMCRAAALREAAKAFFFDIVSGMGEADEVAGQ